MAPRLPASASTELILRYLIDRTLQRKAQRRRTDRQETQRRLAIRTFIYIETDPRRLLDLVLAESSQRQETGWALVVKAFYPSVKGRTIDRFVQRGQLTLPCRPIIPRSIRVLRDRSEDNKAKKKAMQRYREELNDRPVLRRKQHRVCLRPCNS